MVDLDPLNAEDAQVLNDMITRHYAYTGSTVARFVLDDFENQLKNFIKVFPKDYKKALQEKNKVKAEQSRRNSKINVHGNRNDQIKLTINN